MHNRTCIYSAWALLAGLSACSDPAPSSASVAPGAATQTVTTPTDTALIRMDAAAREAAGIAMASAAPATLTTTVTLYGRVTTQPERTRALSARYPGVLKSIDAQIGERVRTGATLATIQANDSLTTYALTSPIDGELIQQPLAQPGETVGDMPILVVADLTTLRVELDVFPGDSARIRPGQTFLLSTGTDAWQAPAAARIDFLAPSMRADTQSRLAVGHFDDPQRQWAPGQAVMAQIVVAQRNVAVSVPTDSVQSLAGVPAVFVASAEGFVARTVRTGDDDGRHIEILEGLTAGERIATGNTFLLKSELLTLGEE